MEQKEQGDGRRGAGEGVSGGVRGRGGVEILTSERRGEGAESALVTVSWREEGEGHVSAWGHDLPLTELWSTEEENICWKIIYLRSKPDVFSPPSF